ncbi:hypothetical protein MIR68_005840, partial [Amoeboaphelidium protococcarum]
QSMISRSSRRIETRSQSQAQSAKSIDGFSNKSKDSAVPSKIGTTANNQNRTRKALGDLSNANGTGANAAVIAQKQSIALSKVDQKVTKTSTTAVQNNNKVLTSKVQVSATSVTSAAIQQKQPTKRRSSGRRKAVEKENATAKAGVSSAVHKEEVGAESKKRLAPHWDDLDAEDAGDPLMASEYVVEIFDYLREQEPKFMPNPNYIDKHDELQWKMRSILIDWLVDVHLKFKMLPESLYLTINLIDRFMSVRTVAMNKLQLVGITAMFIAGKVEEIYPPQLSQYVYISAGGYSHEEICKAERYMLSSLNFKVHSPDPINFLRRCSKADDFDIEARTLAKYLLEITLLDEWFLACAPSLRAASSLYLARVMLDRKKGKWDANLIHYSGYEISDMKPCVLQMMHFLSAKKDFKAIFNKYAAKRFMKCSKFVADWVTSRSELKDWGLKFD